MRRKAQRHCHKITLWQCENKFCRCNKELISRANYRDKNSPRKCPECGSLMIFIKYANDNIYDPHFYEKLVNRPTFKERKEQHKTKHETKSPKVNKSHGIASYTITRVCHKCERSITFMIPGPSHHICPYCGGQLQSQKDRVI